MPFAPEGKKGHSSFAVETMLLRLHFMPQWFRVSDPAMEEALRDKGLMLRAGTVVDAMLIAGPSLTNNAGHGDETDAFRGGRLPRRAQPSQRAAGRDLACDHAPRQARCKLLEAGSAG